jgi:integrase
LTKKVVEKVALTKVGLKRVIEKKFDAERLCLVRDIFVFSCYTGLAYADVKNLKRSDIKTGIDNKEWIFVNRQKTNSASHLPLLAQARKILARYRDHSKCVNYRCCTSCLDQSKNECLFKRNS